MNKQPEAVIFIGIQATGKSTFYQKYFFRSHMRINLDMLKTRHREKTFFQTCLNANQSFVVDNTNPKRADRERYIIPAKDARFLIKGYFFQSRIIDALKRNSQRDIEEFIPEKGVRGSFSKLQMPSMSEGFDELYYVSIEASDSFKIVEWSDEI